MTRELVWTGFMTVDGIIDSPGSESEGHPLGGWVVRTPFDPDAYSLKGEELQETSALVVGKRTRRVRSRVAWFSRPCVLQGPA